MIDRRTLKGTIAADLFRYGGKRTSFPLLYALFGPHPGFTYTYAWRHASAYPKRSLRGFFWHLLVRHLMYRYGFQIPPGTLIGKGLYIGHFGTVVVNGRSKIGENCNIAHSITIGQVNRGKLVGYPTIGNRVWIGTGAVIVGNIHIGNDVLIAPNAYVNCNIPDHSLVIGNPGQITPRDNATDGYVCHVLDS
ncbi:MAG TPA: serine acetyltransferase [bacterium]|nr:serine acetyltransferase [bacterium]